MLWYETLILIYVITHFAAFILLMITDAYNDNGFAWVNPFFIYHSVRVNWFGATFLALIANALIPCYAIIYWVYKLCTVGRK